MEVYIVKKKVKMHGFFSRGEEGEFIWKNYMALRTYLVGINVLGECGIPGSPSSQISCFMWASFFCYITNENHVKCFQFSLFKGLRLWGIVKSPAQLKIVRKQTTAGRERLPFASRVSLTLMKAVM